MWAGSRQIYTTLGMTRRCILAGFTVGNPHIAVRRSLFESRCA